MAFIVADENVHDFSEVTDGAGGDRQVELTNGDGRDWDAFEIVMNPAAPFYVGEVRKYNGIADTESGRVKIDHNRVIRTAQIEVTDTFVVEAEVFFRPGTGSVAGFIVDTASKLAGDIKFGRVTGFGGAATAHTYLEVRPYAFDEARILEV